jgi:hypothetical protein
MKKNSSDHHNSYNKGPNLGLFSFKESPSNSLPTIKCPKNHITSSYHRNLSKTTNAIFVHQKALGVNKLPQKSMDEKSSPFVIQISPLSFISHKMAPAAFRG